MAIIKISDDFDMKKIADSGQCFRAVEVRPGIFRFVTRQSVVYMKQVEPGKFDVSCTVAEWEKTWVEYFDLRTKYAPIREKILQACAGRPYEKYIQDALEFGKGIRILKQEPFETLISFIISQRKNIPSIRNTVEAICNGFGGCVGTPYEQINFFPNVHMVAHMTMFDMSALALGYRSSYVRDAIDKVNTRAVDLEILQYENDKDLLEILQRIRGVGPKVAACVALYAYHRLNIMPIDVWIQKAIDEDFNGNNIFYEFAEYAGVLQQYIFFFKRLAEKGYWLVG